MSTNFNFSRSPHDPFSLYFSNGIPNLCSRGNKIAYKYVPASIPVKVEKNENCSLAQPGKCGNGAGAADSLAKTDIEFVGK